MFGINGSEALILLVLAAVVIGPERLPTYAKQFRTWLSQFRDYAQSAKAQVKSEIGDDVDWSSFDPRQYDPRRIVKEALLGEPQARPPQGAPQVPLVQSLPDGLDAPFDPDAT